MKRNNADEISTGGTRWNAPVMMFYKILIVNVYIVSETLADKTIEKRSTRSFIGSSRRFLFQIKRRELFFVLGK